MSLMNRLAVASNHYQGKYKRVLCVCSAGVLRSPTAALVLSQEPYNFNTRSAGMSQEYALIPVDEALLTWADQVVFMEEDHRRQAFARYPDQMDGMNFVVLAVPDNYRYRDPELTRLIKERYDEATSARSLDETGVSDLHGSGG